MKSLNNLFLYSALLLTLFFTACKDKEDECPEYTCKNGGVCFEQTCACPEGFTGLDCSKEILTPLLITKIVVTRFPAIRVNGEEWDGGWGTTDPDLAVEVEYQGQTIYAAPEDYSEADHNEIYTFDILSGSAVLFQPDDTYKIVLKDRDTYTDDLMGEASFNTLDLLEGNNDYPVTVVVDNSGKVAFEISLEER